MCGNRFSVLQFLCFLTCLCSWVCHSIPLTVILLLTVSLFRQSVRSTTSLIYRQLRSTFVILFRLSVHLSKSVTLYVCKSSSYLCVCVCVVRTVLTSQDPHPTITHYPLPPNKSSPSPITVPSIFHPITQQPAPLVRNTAIWQNKYFLLTWPPEATKAPQQEGQVNGHNNDWFVLH